MIHAIHQHMQTILVVDYANNLVVIIKYGSTGDSFFKECIDYFSNLDQEKRFNTWLLKQASDKFVFAIFSIPAPIILIYRGSYSGAWNRALFLVIGHIRSFNYLFDTTSFSQTLLYKKFN